jgi:hypothetical protein
MRSRDEKPRTTGASLSGSGTYWGLERLNYAVSSRYRQRLGVSLGQWRAVSGSGAKWLRYAVSGHGVAPLA